jgi:light-regulated signal transduction histidine kinase (bacteriophytochrome)
MLSFSILVCATIALAGTMQGTGPFQGPTLHESLLTAEAFVSVSAVMALLLNAAIRERKEKEKSLQGARDNLEHLVQERTRELYEKNRQLEERNRELTSFSYAASHDLQEPLRKIGFFTSKVMESMPAGATNNFLDRIKSSVVRMQRLIENLLSYSLIENNNKLFTETNLNEILRDVKNDLSESLQQTGAMVDAAPLPVVHAIPFQMEQLFTNILQNAIKFRKENTSPHILIEWHLNGDGNYFHLRFTDDGIGFEPENAGRIFELLQKLHGQSEYEGTGIGLAICKKIVEEHGGTIEAKGAVGKGCTIEAVFPAAMMIREASLDREEMEKESAV